MSRLPRLVPQSRDLFVGIAVVGTLSLWIAGWPAALMAQAGLTFEPIQIAELSDSGGLSVRLVSSSTGDVNDDGLDDVVALGLGRSTPFGPLESRVFTVFGSADSAPQQGAEWASPVVVSRHATGDFNGDGFADLVGALQGNAIAVAAGNGDGSFDEFVTVYSGFSATLQSLEVADLDGDEALDIIVPVRDEGKVAIIRGLGNLTFAPATVISVAGGLAMGVRAGDFDGDGDVDLAVLVVAADCCTAPDRIVQLRQESDGSLTALDPIDNMPLAWNVEPGAAAGDVNGDTFDDLVTSNGQNSSVSLFLGGPSGLTAPVVIGGLDFPLSVDVADFDGDGFADIVSGNDGGSLEDKVTVFKGGATVGAGLYLAGGPRNTYVHALDFNGDGLPDIATTDGSSSIVGVLLQEAAPDTTPPDVTIVANATAEVGEAVTYTASAHDTVSGDLPVDCSPLSGFAAHLGSNPIACSATDEAGNTGQASFTVTGVDTIAPVLQVPADIVEVAGGREIRTGVAVAYSASATDAPNPVPPIVTCSPASGSRFPVGTTTVSCTAADASGNSTDGTFRVIVMSPGQAAACRALDKVIEHAANLPPRARAQAIDAALRVKSRLGCP